MKRGYKIEADIVFDLTKITDDQREHLRDAEACLNKAGIIFDHSTGRRQNEDGQDLIWQLDFSLQGPAEVRFTRVYGTTESDTEVDGKEVSEEV